MSPRLLPHTFSDGRTFTIGQPVRATERAMRQGAVHAFGELGVVMGFSHSRDCIRVKPDRLKSTDTYHVTFWEAIPKDAPAPLSDAPGSTIRMLAGEPLDP